MFRKGDIVLCGGDPSEDFKEKHWHGASYQPRSDEPGRIEMVYGDGPMEGMTYVKFIVFEGYGPREVSLAWPTALLVEAGVIHQMDHRIKMLEFRLDRLERPDDDD